MSKVLSGVSRPTGKLRLDLCDINILQYVGVFFMGILLSRAVLMGELYPFGMGFLVGVCMAIPKQRRVAFLGVVLGTILSVKGLNLLGYLGSLGILYNVFCRYQKNNPHWLAVPAIIIAIHLLTRGSIVFFTGSELYLWIEVFFESFFVGVLSMVTFTGIQAYGKATEGKILSAEEWTSLALVILGVLVGVGGFFFLSCDVQSVLSRWLVLWGALLGGPGGGAAIGAAVGLAPSIQGVLTIGPVAYYALGGLLGGVFNLFKKVGVIVGFALANLLLSFYFTEDLVIIQALKETGVAVLTFLVFSIPIKGETVLAVKILKKPVAEEENLYYAERLLKMADVFYELEKVLRAEGREKIETNELNHLFNKVTSQVCEGCSLRRVCWEQDFYKTYRAILEVCTKLEVKGLIVEKDFGSVLKRRCMRLRELSVALNSQLEVLKLVNSFEKQMRTCRGMVNQQLLGLAKIVEDFSGEMRRKTKRDEHLEKLLAVQMAEKGIYLEKIDVIEPPGGEKEIHIEQSVCQNENWCAAMVASNISQIMNSTFIIKSRNCGKSKGNCSYVLVPARALQISVGKAYCPKDGIAVSGDICSALTLPNHRFALIMCDGMGVGPEAHSESSLAVHILEKLLLAGFSPQIAVRTVNTALLIKSPRENFATLDVAVINQINGQCDFIKIGGAPSLIRDAKGLKVVKSSSLPVGILEEVKSQIFRYTLRVNNWVIMMSDGVWEVFDNVTEPEQWLEEFLEQVDIAAPQTLADYLLYLAKKTVGNRASDDMCLLVARLENKAV